MKQTLNQRLGPSISLRNSVDWLSLASALVIGVVFRYVNFSVPW